MNHEKKYLKYKSKYLYLKNIQENYQKGGGIFGIDYKKLNMFNELDKFLKNKKFIPKNEGNNNEQEIVFLLDDIEEKLKKGVKTRMFKAIKYVINRYKNGDLENNNSQNEIFDSQNKEFVFFLLNNMMIIYINHKETFTITIRTIFFDGIGYIMVKYFNRTQNNDIQKHMFTLSEVEQTIATNIFDIIKIYFTIENNEIKNKKDIDIPNEKDRILFRLLLEGITKEYYIIRLTSNSRNEKIPSHKNGTPINYGERVMAKIGFLYRKLFQVVGKVMTFPPKDV